jgi:hypothetical protein
MSQFAGFDIRGEAIFGWFSPLMRFPGGASERSQAEYELFVPARHPFRTGISRDLPLFCQREMIVF